MGAGAAITRKWNLRWNLRGGQVALADPTGRHLGDTARAHDGESAGGCCHYGEARSVAGAPTTAPAAISATQSHRSDSHLSMIGRRGQYHHDSKQRGPPGSLAMEDRPARTLRLANLA